MNPQKGGLQQPVGDYMCSRMDSRMGSPCTFTVKADTYLGEKDALSIYLQTTRHAQNSTLCFNFDSQRKKALMVLCTARWGHISWTWVQRMGHLWMESVWTLKDTMNCSRKICFDSETHLESTFFWKRRKIGLNMKLKLAPCWRGISFPWRGVFLRHAVAVSFRLRM